MKTFIFPLNFNPVSIHHFKFILIVLLYLFTSQMLFLSSCSFFFFLDKFLGIQLKHSFFYSRRCSSFEIKSALLFWFFLFSHWNELNTRLSGTRFAGNFFRRGTCHQGWESFNSCLLVRKSWLGYTLSSSKNRHFVVFFGSALRILKFEFLKTSLFFLLNKSIKIWLLLTLICYNIKFLLAISLPLNFGIEFLLNLFIELSKLFLVHLFHWNSLGVFGRYHRISLIWSKLIVHQKITRNGFWGSCAQN